jgi:thioredoxin-like negative regulator of GroEL
MQNQAEEEFRAGNYAAAEQHFRKLLPTARFRALTGFQVFLCLIKQGKIEEAKQMAKKFPYGPAAKNPSGIYASAALALLEGRSDDTRQAIETARRQYPLITPLYDAALVDAKIAPER